MTILRLLAHALLLRPLLRLLTGVAVEGREHLRGLGPFILIANHNSHLDAALLFGALPLRAVSRTRAVAAGDYFAASRSLGFLARFFFNAIFIRRDGGDGDPLAEVGRALESGHSLVFFPEGTRGRPGEMEQFKSGIGRLVVRFPEVPVVPAFLGGTERGLPKSAAFPLPFCASILIGPPRLPSGSPRDIASSLEAAVRELAAADVTGRHRRPEPKPPPLAIAFLGIDGSGKSTLSRRAAVELSAGRAVCRIGDRIELFEEGAERDLQPLLTEAVRGRIGAWAKRAGSLRSYELPKLTELLLRNHLLGEAARWYRPDLLVLDGSPLLNLLAWAVLYKKEPLDPATCVRVIRILTGSGPEVPAGDPVFARFPELRHLRRLGLDRLVLPDLVVFLDVSPVVACGRIETRGERRQAHETEEKLARLAGAYRGVCAAVGEDMGIPTLILDGSGPLDEVAAGAARFVAEHMASKEAAHGSAP